MSICVTMEVDINMYDISVTKFKDQLLREADTLIYQREYKPRMREIVNTWKNKPRPSAKKEQGAGFVALLIRPVAMGGFLRTGIAGDKLWAWLSNGVRGHPIVPKKAKALKFKSGFLAKTMPNRVISRPGGYMGNDIFTKKVDWPGIEPRNFEAAMLKDIGEQRLLVLMGQAAINALAKSLTKMTYQDLR